MESAKESNPAPAQQAQCPPQAAKAAKEEEVIKAVSESSPYMQYDNIEDYKMKGYGAHGHLPTIDPLRHAGTTDAPTPSGSAVGALCDR